VILFFFPEGKKKREKKTRWEKMQQLPLFALLFSPV